MSRNRIKLTSDVTQSANTHCTTTSVCDIKQNLATNMTGRMDVLFKRRLKKLGSAPQENPVRSRFRLSS